MKKIVYLANNEYTGNNKALCNLNSLWCFSVHHNQRSAHLHMYDFTIKIHTYLYMHLYTYRYERDR